MQICAVGIVFSVLAGVLFVKFSLADIQSIAFGFDGKINSDGIASPWKLKKNTAADVKIASDSGEEVVQLKSDNASFLAGKRGSCGYRRSTRISHGDGRLQNCRRLEMSAAEKRMIRRFSFLVAFEGRKILSYIWDSNAPEGTVADESIAWPVSLKVKVLALKSGSSKMRASG